MQYFQTWKFSVFLFFLYSKSNGCTDKNIKKPVVAALLNLHTGERCEKVNLHALQQLAALQSALKGINLEFLPDGIEINLQVFDTCSTAKGTKIATLEALVAAEQTCINTPLFLGFIGNENKESFEVTQSISKVFNIAHILPYSFGSLSNEMDNVYSISSYPYEHHSEALKILLNKLGIRNAIIAFENNVISKMKVEDLIKNSKEDLCFLKTITYINNDEFGDQLNQGSNEDALLIIIENVNILANMKDYLVKYYKQIIISSGQVGYENVLFPLKKACYILQFMSLKPLGNLSEHYNEDLLTMYNKQQLLKCSKKTDKIARECNSSVVSAVNIKAKDWTADLLQYGLILYGNSVRIAAYKKCRNVNGSRGFCSNLNSLSQKEWNDFLRESSVLVQMKSGSSNEKINFNMNIGGKFSIDLHENGLTQRIGNIENSRLKLHDNYKFSAQSEMVTSTKCIDTVPTVPAKPPFISYQPGTSLIPENGFFDFDIHDYELIAFLSGIVFGILFLLGLVVYVIYATVKVKSSRSNSSFRGSVHTRTSE